MSLKPNGHIGREILKVATDILDNGPHARCLESDLEAVFEMNEAQARRSTFAYRSLFIYLVKMIADKAKVDEERLLPMIVAGGLVSAIIPDGKEVDIWEWIEETKKVNNNVDPELAKKKAVSIRESLERVLKEAEQIVR